MRDVPLKVILLVVLKYLWWDDEATSCGGRACSRKAEATQYIYPT